MLLIQFSEAERPVHLFSDEDGHQLAGRPMQSIEHDMQQWQAASATNFVTA